MGYLGVAILMALESSFSPFPSEVVIPPAAYLAAKGEMSLGAVIFCGTLGSLLGAILNYWLALRFGRPFSEKYGRNLLINTRSREKTDRFFDLHGHISTFVGRLLPGIRQYISLLAGLARMNFFNFCDSTVVGARLWVAVLAGLGYWFARNQQLVLQNLHWVTVALICACTLGVIVYWRRWKRRKTS